VSTLDDIVRQVRRIMHDRPVRVVAATPVADASAASVELVAGHGARLSQGSIVEWDDGTGEVDSVASVAADVMVFDVRGLDNPADAVAHDTGARLLVDPRYDRKQVEDQASSVLDALWPWVWVPRETTLAYQSTNDYFLPTATDIANVVYAYQLSGGRLYRYDMDWLPPRLADDANFPNGAVILKDPLADSTTIYLAYRAVPTAENLLTRQIPLVALGVAAKLQMLEEATHVEPASTAIEQLVGDGARARAGALFESLFESRRTDERNRLEAEEAQGSHLVRSGL
jgi:hypothetical protein